MHFELSEEQQQIKMSVREFAESEIAPHVLEWDESQHFPIELKPQLAELGLMGVLFPEEYGGAGMGYVEYATIIEELSRVDGSVGISVPHTIRSVQITSTNTVLKNNAESISNHWRVASI